MLTVSENRKIQAQLREAKEKRFLSKTKATQSNRSSLARVVSEQVSLIPLGSHLLPGVNTRGLAKSESRRNSLLSCSKKNLGWLLQNPERNASGTLDPTYTLTRKQSRTEQNRTE